MEIDFITHCHVVILFSKHHHHHHEGLKSEESTKAAADMCVSYFKQRVAIDLKDAVKAKDKSK
jgi:hypothetical protein